MKGVRQQSLTRPSGIFWVLVATFLASGWWIWSRPSSVKIGVFLFVVTGWVISLCLHEYAHAVMALRAGDRGVIDRGYLTLNPRLYAHPVLSVVLPLVFLLIGGIGLPGGAVWINQAMMSRKSRSVVSAAGPLANGACALVLCAPFLFLRTTIQGPQEFWAAVAFLGFLQLTAVLVNLLPIPGVDGGNMIEPWLGARWRHGFAQMAPYGIILLFALLSAPRINRVFFDIVNSLSDFLGLPVVLIYEGYQLFRFWVP